MAGSRNLVILVGNLGKDPEVRTMPNGNKVANFSIATSESWKDKSTGEKREKTEWHTIAVFHQGEGDGLVGIAEKYLKKGSKVYLEGKLQTRKWQDQEGKDRYTTEVVVQGFGAQLILLDGKGEGGGNRPPPANGPEDYGRESSRSSGGGSSGPAPADDSIPF